MTCSLNQLPVRQANNRLPCIGKILVYFIDTLARELEMLMFAVGVLLPIAPFLTVDL
jgi:VIT1/CCC1 family predicted Fe2+/Mn2+ transporter